MKRKSTSKHRPTSSAKSCGPPTKDRYPPRLQDSAQAPKVTELMRIYAVTNPLPLLEQEYLLQHLAQSSQNFDDSDSRVNECDVLNKYTSGDNPLINIAKARARAVVRNAIKDGLNPFNSSYEETVS